MKIWILMYLICNQITNYFDVDNPNAISWLATWHGMQEIALTGLDGTVNYDACPIDVSDTIHFSVVIWPSHSHLFEVKLIFWNDIRWLIDIIFSLLDLYINRGYKSIYNIYPYNHLNFYTGSLMIFCFLMFIFLMYRGKLMQTLNCDIFIVI